jgi:hypothetical protein
MSAAQRTILPVGLDPTVRSLVREVLAPIRVASVAEGGAAALDSASSAHYDGLVVAYPLADVPIRAFLGSVRKLDSPCRGAGVVLVAAERSCDAAAEHLGRGANRVVPLERVEQHLRPAVEGVLGVAPRLAVTFPVRLTIMVPGFARKVFCQTINVSTSGVLLRIPHSYPAGTDVMFEMLVPAETGPVRGQAIVVRAATQGRERFPGMALSFSSLERNGRERLERFIARAHQPPLRFPR